MKKYLLDNHKITKTLIDSKREDIYTIYEIASEFNPANDGFLRIERSSIKILFLKDHHMRTMVEILNSHGDDYELIDLFSNEGAGDIALLAYVLGEKKYPEHLFDKLDEYIIVTDDKGIKKHAKYYGIKVIDHL